MEPFNLFDGWDQQEEGQQQEREQNDNHSYKKKLGEITILFGNWLRC